MTDRDITQIAGPIDPTAMEARADLMVARRKEKWRQAVARIEQRRQEWLAQQAAEPVQRDLAQKVIDEQYDDSNSPTAVAGHSEDPS